MIQFKVIGKINGKGRPKFSNRGGFVRAYTPEKTVNYENFIQLSFLQSGAKSFGDKAIVLIVEAYFSVPKTYSKKLKTQAYSGKLYYTKKPDADNILKIVSDALNKLAYNDDCQIVTAVIKRKYVECEADQERLVIVLNALE